MLISSHSKYRKLKLEKHFIRWKGGMERAVIYYDLIKRPLFVLWFRFFFFCCCFSQMIQQNWIYIFLKPYINIFVQQNRVESLLDTWHKFGFDAVCVLRASGEWTLSSYSFGLEHSFWLYVPLYPVIFGIFFSLF